MAASQDWATASFYEDILRRDAGRFGDGNHREGVVEVKAQMRRLKLQAITLWCGETTQVKAQTRRLNLGHQSRLVFLGFGEVGEDQAQVAGVGGVLHGPLLEIDSSWKWSAPETMA